MHANIYIISKNSIDMLLYEFTYPTINMLKTALKIHISGLFASGMSLYFRYLYMTGGNVISIATNPTKKNMNAISFCPCACAVIAAMVIPMKTIQ